LRAYARNVEGNTTLLGAITVDNAGSALPFGTLDTPDPLTPISGAYVNFGWALTPQPPNTSLSYHRCRLVTVAPPPPRTIGTDHGVVNSLEFSLLALESQHAAAYSGSFTL